MVSVRKISKSRPLFCLKCFRMRDHKQTVIIGKSMLSRIVLQLITIPHVDKVIAFAWKCWPMQKGFQQIQAAPKFTGIKWISRGVTNGRKVWLLFIACATR